MSELSDYKRLVSGPAEARLRATIADLKGRLAVADEAIMALNGCFPLDRATEQQRRLNDAAKIVREITGDDHAARATRAHRYRCEWLEQQRVSV